ncbi:MAG: hypothetical protein J1E34_06455 [Oscillospiraceae bacterium]|nr:hypothetical protein [Oscillospiraceae bacterium]
MKKIENVILSRKGTAILIISAVLTAVICLIMNLFLIPAIESAADGLRIFDMSFLYSSDSARSFLQALSAEGKNLYLYRQLPLDFFYPVCYGCFFIFAFVKLQKKLNAFALLPTALAVFDYAENTSIELMLRSSGFSSVLAVFGSAFTSVKTVLMYGAFVFLIVFAVKSVLRKKKNKSNSAVNV